MDIKTRRIIRAIRRLATPTPEDRADARLAMISELATGKLDPSEVFKQPDGNKLVRDLKKALGRPEPEERKAKPTKDRKERASRDRALDDSEE
jgi:hypothetical protein